MFKVGDRVKTHVDNIGTIVDISVLNPVSKPIRYKVEMDSGYKYYFKESELTLVSDISMFKVGDRVNVIWNRQEGTIIHVDVYGRHLNLVKYSRGYVEVYFNDEIELISKDVTSRNNKECTCGAKHTGNPKYHLPYCKMDNK